MSRLMGSKCLAKFLNLFSNDRLRITALGASFNVTARIEMLLNFSSQKFRFEFDIDPMQKGVAKEIP